jgi:molybdopterin guanine dinucleotide-containing S/N-oxide reductase-like protein
MVQKKKGEARQKTCIKGTGLSSFGDNSNMTAVDIKNDKIIRIRPFHFDWKYKPEEWQPWKLEAHGKVFKPPMKSMVPPHGLAYKKRIFSPNRILYPLRRVDWDPNGERNPQNRGTSKYVRISWDEATDIIASEIKRVIRKYGPEAVLCQADGHGETKVVHSTHGCNTGLMNLLGGFTQQIRNPDSWEGWYWGAKHAWGCEPIGMYTSYLTNIFPDMAEHTQMIIHQGCDQETTPWGFWTGQMPSLYSYWFTEIGIKSIYICPDLNYGAAVHADKWIPVLPNTDTALQLAIAYQWITNGTYDKKYIATHAYGFDKFEEYVLGKEDGTPKTPKWASLLCGVPSRIIKALAKEWASKTTTVAHGFGGPYIRGSYSHEPARMEVLLLAMQGLGKPGTHQLTFVGGSFFGLGRGTDAHTLAPGGVVRPDVKAAYRAAGASPTSEMQKQIIPKPMIHDAILDGHFDIYGSSWQMSDRTEQFVRYVYPAPGCSPIHMIWTDTPCLLTCWNDSNRNVDGYRHPSIECIVAQHPWMENDCLFADIILPISTKFELDDIGTDNESAHFSIIYRERKCVEPIGESRSDYEAVCAVAEKLGLLEQYTEGKSIDEWIKFGFDESGVPAAGLTTWENLCEKDYYMIPTDPNWKKYRTGMIDFYEYPEKHPLTTPSGKIEFFSKGLAEHFPDDEERPPVPHWIPYGESHQESLLLERAKKYPLLVVSNHPRWRVHAQLDDMNWFHEIVTGKVRGSDGYLYEPLWLHPSEAKKRGINNGDIVKIYNERGVVLAGAYVTERIMPGVAYIDHGARYDPIVPGEIDRGGAINTITPHHGTSRNCRGGMVVSGFLVEVERANLDELQKKYPEAFSRPYHRGSGLDFNRVLAGSEKK